MQLLTFTNLYPDATRPRHGIFIEERLQQLLRTGRVAAEVICPVPWFPRVGLELGGWSRYADVPKHEVRQGVPVTYPRYPVIPRVGMGVAPLLMARWAWPTVRRWHESQRSPYVIDSHYLYPDGVAAARLAARLAVPLVMTARGSDVNVLMRYPGPRRQVLAAIAQACRVITVSEALRTRLIDYGVAADKVVTLRNGVDRELFRPLDRQQCRRQQGIDRPAVLCVGNLVLVKGFDRVIRALAGKPDALLLLVGEGPEEGRLRALAARLGMASRVRFLGYRSREQLVELYSACDLLVLSSVSEGMPNVVLESLACGCPVVATDVGGVAEVLDERSGVIVGDDSPAALRAAIQAVIASPPDRAEIRQNSRKLGWPPVVAGLEQVFAAALESRPGRQ